MSNTPSDAEIRELWENYNPMRGIESFARAVLAKWGAPPAVTGEPFCYVSVNKQGDITRTMKRKDKWTNIPLYTTPQPTQPQAGSVPLTDARIKELIEDGVFLGNCKEIVRAIEQAHGLTQKGGSNAD